jgi:AraC-like DNA-binding protein
VGFSDIAALVPGKLFAEPMVTRFLPLPGADGRLVLFASEFDGSERRQLSHQRIGNQRFVPLPGWYGLSMCLGGSGTVRAIGGRPTEVRAGSMIRFTDRPHGEVWKRVDGLRELVMCIDVGTGQALGDLGLWPAGEAVVDGCVSAAAVRAWLGFHRDAHDEAMATGELTRRLIDLLMIAWSSMDSAGDAAFAAQARQLLAANLIVGAAVPEIARKLGLSERQFRRRFQRVTGLSPNAYRRQLRLERACRLLADLPVAEVARKLGYADAAVFSHQFSAAMGVPPGRLRGGRAKRDV